MKGHFVSNDVAIVEVDLFFLINSPLHCVTRGLRLSLALLLEPFILAALCFG